MSFQRTLIALALLVGITMPVGAQTSGRVNLLPGAPIQPQRDFSVASGLAFGNGSLYGSVFRAPVLASAPGVPTVDIFGAAFGARTGVPGYSAWFTPLSAADFTRTYGSTQRGWDVGIAEQRYRAAAWLATQYFPADPVRASEWPTYQAAMWSLMGQSGGLDDPYALPGEFVGAPSGRMEQYLQMALANANRVDADAWTIVSDASGSNPEFLVVQAVQTVQNVESVVPEPETVILLVTGLLALGAVAYFRGISA